MISLPVKSSPFPHIIADELWDVNLLTQIKNDFPAPEWAGWQRFGNAKENKLASAFVKDGSALSSLMELFKKSEFLESLQKAFNLEGPISLDVVGGGMHMIPPGGFLATHVDFNRSDAGMHRVLNMLIYLNDGWVSDNGGELYLFESKDDINPMKVEPLFNRTVIFRTDDKSWHGHPYPTGDGFWRKSIAVYFYQPNSPTKEIAPSHSTIFLEK